MQSEKISYDRIILELLSRVSELESEVESLKDRLDNMSQTTETDLEPIEQEISVTDSNRRDTTKYMLDGVKYGKNRLVLAIVTKYAKMHTGITADGLIKAFNSSLQGSLGVVKKYSEAKSISDYTKRFFCKPDEIIKTSTDECVVCTQWHTDNIGNLIARAKELGIDVSVLK